VNGFFFKCRLTGIRARGNVQRYKIILDDTTTFEEEGSFECKFDVIIRDIMIILDITILFSRETEFLLNKNSRYNDIFDTMILCRVTGEIIISNSTVVFLKT